MSDQSLNDLFVSLPSEIHGWKASGEDAVYNRETLFDYMNGGAELYLAYDFRKVCTRRFAGPGENEIIMDVYDMGSSEEAFGIFSMDLEDEGAGMGQGSEYGFGLLRFWKSHFFVSINALGDEKLSEPVILELGKAVAAQIKSEGPKPALLQALPEKTLRENRTSFFHSNISLNNRFFIASENILNLNNKTNCVFAEYEVDNANTASFLFIQYESHIQAQEAYESFLESYMPETQDAGLAQMENGKWTLARVEKDMVAIVFETPDKEWAYQFLSEVKFNKR